jgi:hypothetical protein
MNYVVLAQPPACWGGPLPAGNAGDHFKELPKDSQNLICKNLRSSGGKNSSCPSFKALMQACSEMGTSSGDKRPDCDSPTPWFDPPPGCKDMQAPVTAIKDKVVTVSVCGYTIFQGSPDPPIDELVLVAYRDVIRESVQSTIGSKVCCDTLRESARTGVPCSPANDIDCDGIPNARDTRRDGTVVYPDIDLFTRAAGATIDDFPVGLDPDDPNFMPGSTARDSKDVGDCPCKWQLTSGKLACSPDGTQDHVYTATWKCPANGKEVFTTKRANANQPCREYKRSGGSLGHFINWMSTNITLL